MIHEGIKIGLTQKMRAYSRSQVLKHLVSEYMLGLGIKVLRESWLPRQPVWESSRGFKSYFCY